MSDTEIIHAEHAASLRPVTGFGEMSVASLIARKQKMQEVMQAVMREGSNGHYGLIPGCGDKPSLFKSGAEVLATTFGLAPRFVVTQTDLPNGHREYRVVCTLIHIGTGANCGEGVGCCSTMESKYRWRGGERKCPSCGKPTIIKGKDEYGGGWLCFAKKGGCGAKWPNGAKEIEGQGVGRVENPDVADTYNTVLKMAKKRAQVDATLTATGASDIFTQDIEDLDRRAEEFPAPQPPPATKPSAPAGEDAAERKRLTTAIKRHGSETVRAVAGRLKITAKGLDACTLDDLKKILAELDGPPPDDGYDPIGDEGAGRDPGMEG